MAAKMFRALEIPNYRLWIIGALVSNIGTWMQRVAQDWLVLTELTDHDAVATGITTGLQFLPVLVLAPYAGLIADRCNKRHLLMVTQSFMGLCALILGVLVVTDSAQLWHVYVLAGLLGVGASFDAPARQAFVSEVVPKSHLANAVALNSANFNLARLAGPGIAGAVIALVGTGLAFLLNGASFLAVIISLVFMRKDALHPTTPVARAKGQVREGLSYVKGRKDLLLIFFLAFIIGTFGLNFQLTNALMATEVYGVGAGEYGILGSIMAVGTFAGALLAARRSAPRWRFLIGGGVFFGIAALASAWMPNYLLFALMLIPVGLGALTFLNSCNTMVQMSVPGQYRARVLALYLMVVQGGTPIGSPMVGWFAELFGTQMAVSIGAVLSLLASLLALFLWQKFKTNAVPLRYQFREMLGR
ncbi:MFS transporter [Arthrobacter sp. NIO-1057]|uniref:MFS transporter n=1 Tax=Arthrobacter sp. NIO-1057 TaxID=993071 RepID=UPI0008183CA4|nr:MFS transporter [Arthrobacter sp. NIO-1057]SCC49317.1 Predicted arabinose efflux permease, MFS family [Arthrobacter sp. NIO-1057]